MEQYSCCICKNTFNDWGNNPFPCCAVKDETAKCCDGCNTSVVIPMRIRCSMNKNVKSPQDAYKYYLKMKLNAKRASK
jgi:hypothetical protein